MFRIENNCVGCERCVNCGQREQPCWVCDECEGYADEWEPLYEYEGQELCESCLKEKLVSKYCDECDDTKCASCGAEAEEMYYYDGQWYCEDCILKCFDKVDMSE